MKQVISYIGSKKQLLPFLDEVIFSKLPKNTKILDAFTGTTTVSLHLQKNYQFQQYLSDFSDYSKVISSLLFSEKISLDIINYAQEIIKITESECVDSLNGVVFNELSIHGKPKTLDIDILNNQEIKSRMFFTAEVGNKIDFIRNYIKNLYNDKKINSYEKDFLLTLLISFADKNANTTSVYGAYLKKPNKKTYPLDNDLIDFLLKSKKENRTSPIAYYKSDIIQTLEMIPEMDVIYFDPPYNTRKYESNYHILNYLADLNFNTDYIKYNSKTAISKQKVINRFGSKKMTRDIFSDMILHGINKASKIYISYSSDGEMTLEEINKICCENNLNLNYYLKPYKKYKSKNIEQEKELNEIIYEIMRNN